MPGLVGTLWQRAHTPLSLGLEALPPPWAPRCGDRCPWPLLGSSRSYVADLSLYLTSVTRSVVRNSMFYLESPACPHAHLPHPGGPAQGRGGKPCPGLWFPLEVSSGSSCGIQAPSHGPPSHFIFSPHVCLEGQWCREGGTGTGRHSPGAPASGELGVCAPLVPKGLWALVVAWGWVGWLPRWPLWQRLWLEQIPCGDGVSARVCQPRTCESLIDAQVPSWTPPPTGAQQPTRHVTFHSQVSCTDVPTGSPRFVPESPPTAPK